MLKHLRPTLGCCAAGARAGQQRLAALHVPAIDHPFLNINNISQPAHPGSAAEAELEALFEKATALTGREKKKAKKARKKKQGVCE